MYNNNQRNKVPMNQPPSSPLSFTDSFAPVNGPMQQPLQSPNTMLMGEGFYDSSSSYPTSGPVMAPTQQLPSQQQYQPPNWNRRKKWLHKAEPPYQYRQIHESSGTVPNDRSTGVNPDARNNPRNGKVRRTPSKKPFKLMADCNSI